jgi:hypothetical protein
MSFRLPRNLDPQHASDKALDAFHHEVLAEKAAALGRAGRLLEKQLMLLKACADVATEDALLGNAADAAHHYFIQRELCGLFAHQSVIDDYAIPRAVLARIGAKKVS